MGVKKRQQQWLVQQSSPRDDSVNEMGRLVAAIAVVVVVVVQ